MARLGESLTMNLTRSMAASGGFDEENGQVLGSSTRSPRMGRAVPGTFVRLAERKDPGWDGEVYTWAFLGRTLKGN